MENKVIDRISEIVERLRKEGKVTTIPLSAFAEMNKHMKEVRREFIIKSAKSEQEAANIWLD